MRITIDGAEWKVGFKHDEVTWTPPDGGGSSKRRRTLCYIEGPQGTLKGSALCHPSDNFARVKGRRISMTHALEPLPRATRKQLWEGYFQAIYNDRLRGIERSWGVPREFLTQLVCDAATGGQRG
jgi:hypothetical protein